MVLVTDELANAAARGDLQRLKELLDGATDPNTINSYGRTPIQVRETGEERSAAPPWLRNGGAGSPRAAFRRWQSSDCCCLRRGA